MKRNIKEEKLKRWVNLQNSAGLNSALFSSSSIFDFKKLQEKLGLQEKIWLNTFKAGIVNLQPEKVSANRILLTAMEIWIQIHSFDLKELDKNTMNLINCF